MSQLIALEVDHRAVAEDYSFWTFTVLGYLRQSYKDSD